jgi:preprotein translocase subunit SecF
MNIMKLRPLFLLISTILLSVSVFSLVKWQFKLSADFTGGSTLEVQFDKQVSENDIKAIYSKESIDIRSLQLDQKKVLIKFPNITQSQKSSIDSALKNLDPKTIELKYETVGPVLGRELMQKTLVAIILSSFALLVFIGTKFSDFSFGVSAVLAMLHDTFILLGAFSLLGHFFGAELDSLFVTALLTTLSASVHDTVVTFDRIRELRQKNFKLDWVDLANTAVSEVIVRSINNSMTIIFMLLSLVLLGGNITRWFSLALLIGVVCGTYSSTGVAIPLVLLWKKKKSN